MSDIKKTYTIYKLINPDGQVYVGKTSNIKLRINQYKSVLAAVKKQRLLYNSLISYGFSNHSIEIIEQFQSNSSYANDKEMFWIRTNMCNRNKWTEQSGLNLTDGGKGNHGYKHTIESKRKLSQKHIGKIFSEKHIENLKKSHTDNIKWCKSIDLYKDGKLVESYSSIIRAAKAIGCRASRISDCLAGRRNSSRGFTFKYKNND